MTKLLNSIFILTLCFNYIFCNTVFASDTNLKISEEVLSTVFKPFEYFADKYGTPDFDSGEGDTFGRQLSYANGLCYMTKPYETSNRIQWISGNTELMFDNFTKDSYNIKDVVEIFDIDKTATYEVSEGLGDYVFEAGQKYVSIITNDYTMEITYNDDKLHKTDFVRIFFNTDKTPINSALDYVSQKYSKDGYSTDESNTFIFEEDDNSYLIFVGLDNASFTPAVIVQKDTNKIIFDTSVQDFWGGMLDEYLKDIDIPSTNDSTSQNVTNADSSSDNEAIQNSSQTEEYTQISSKTNEAENTKSNINKTFILIIAFAGCLIALTLIILVLGIYFIRKKK
jgi:hypothetical protein